MKSLLSDSVIAKFRILPEAVWFLISVVAVFFAGAYNYITSSADAIAILMDNVASMDVELQINPIAFIAVSCVFTSFLQAAIFELINHLVAGVLLARFSAKTNRSDLKFRLRLCYIYSNLLIGLIGISYFFTQTTNGAYTGVFSLDNVENDVELILSSIVPFSSLTFFLYVFYEDLRKSFLPQRNHPRALLFIGRLYFGIYLILTLIGALRAVIFHSNALSVIMMVSYWLDFGVVAIWSAIAYLYYLKLKKEPSDNNNGDDPQEPIIVITETKQHNIYDDFGF